MQVGCHSESTLPPTAAARVTSRGVSGNAQADRPDTGISNIFNDLDIKSVRPQMEHRTLFSEVASASGIDFICQTGSTGKSLMVESTMGGGGWLDYDRDGLCDLYLGQGGDPSLPPSPSQPADCLYRNMGEAGFVEVAQSAGIDERSCTNGVSTADFDNDGFDDLLICNVGHNVLFHNRGDGTFEPVETATIAAESRWSSTAAWGDIDRDGDLDLYVCRYCLYDPLHPKICHHKSGKIGTCHPKEVEPCPDEFYVNQGDGTFVACAQERGLFGPGNRALGVVIADFDNDDWPDIYVANDTTDNFLFINQRDGNFLEQAKLLGCAVNINGSPQASMGVALGDYDRNGFLDLYLTHFSKEWNTLYQNLGPKGFHDVTAQARLSTPTMDKLGFGVVMEDFDLDGFQELLVANGHIDDRREEGVEFQMQTQLFAYNGATWDECGSTAGPFFQRKLVGRGLATSDYDGDGDLDAVLIPQNSPVAILRNDSPRGRWLKLSFIGHTSNRHGIGTRVTLRSTSGTWMRELAGGTSYAAAHEPVLIFGMGENAGPYEAEIRWPDGKRQVIKDLTPDQALVIHEPGEPMNQFN